MTDGASAVKCGKQGCEVATTGLCAEGHDPARSCPFYGQDSSEELEAEELEEEDAVEGEPAEEGRVPLPTGEVLVPLEVDGFLRRRPATFVTIVGDRESGKTTLICAIYDRFLKGPFGGLLFAGSRTLVALEKRSHLARVESGLPHPDTPRTSIADGLRFFHFAVARADRVDTCTDLMLSDRAGEAYSRARGNSALAADMIEVSHADRLVLLLDGARVADPVERAGAMQSVRQTLRVFLDGGALGASSIVQLVTTKIDLLAHHPESEDIDARLAAFRERLDHDFGPRVAALSYWDTAARDPTGGFAPAHGLDALLTEWVRPRRVAIARAKLSTPLRSEFDRLLLRTPMEVVP